MVDDYNIEANKHYTYTFTFNSVGQIGSDSRIETMTAEVDYRERESSNCYIINPSMVDSRTYYLPVEDRINTFWTDYANDANKVLSAFGDNWVVEVLWYDCDSNPVGSSESELTSSQLYIKPIYSSTDNEYQQSVKVTLGERFDNYGNVVFAVKSSENGEILWSWHLWITDYNPDSREWNPKEGQYTYATTGGQIHRYKDDETHKYWDVGGIYEYSFIMDRNIGARGTDYETSTAGCLYYQYGRKDPFPTTYATSVIDGGITYSVLNNRYVYNPIYFATAVQNPMRHSVTASGVSWCSEVPAEVTSIDWYDKYAPLEGSVKSIFDPSPLGWRVPSIYVWSNFDDDGSATASSSIVEWNSDLMGFYYNINENPVAFYPAIGAFSGVYSSGTVYSNSCQGYSTYSSRLYLSPEKLDFSNNTSSSGFPVRPVKDVQ